MLGARLTLDDNLTATATGTARLFQQLTVSASGGNGEGVDTHIGILDTCCEEGRTLRTET